MSTRSFKTNAWNSHEAADRYNDATAAAPRLFKLIREELFVRYIQRHAPPGGGILDLGCGSGLLSIPLHDLGYKVVASDVSQGMLDVLKRERGAREFELRQGDAFAIPARDDEFDLTVSRMFIQHFAEWPRVLAEKARVTRPGGIVMFDFGNQEHVDASGLLSSDESGFSYDDDVTNPQTFYAVTTAEAMRRQADVMGLDVVEISPMGLLFCNIFLWKKVKAKGMMELNKKLDILLESNQARDLLLTIEELLMPMLPKSVTYCNMTVLRKR